MFMEIWVLENSIWRNVIAAKYREEPNGWVSRKLVGLVGCSIWKGIFGGMDSFLRFNWYKVNNGESVQFWTDPWCSDVPLNHLVPTFFSLAECKLGTVKNHMIRT